MKLYLETSSAHEIREATEIGVIDGIIFTRRAGPEGRDGYLRALQEAIHATPTTVYADVTGTDRRGIVKEVDELLKLGPNLGIRVGSFKEGIKACKTLSARDVPVITHLCYQPGQAMAAGKAKARFVGVYVGGSSDEDFDGIPVIGKVRRIFDQFQIQSGILAAGIKSSLQLVEAALAGADAACVSFSVIEQMLHHPLTDLRLRQIVETWGEWH